MAWILMFSGRNSNFRQGPAVERCTLFGGGGGGWLLFFSLLFSSTFYIVVYLHGTESLLLGEMARFINVVGGVRTITSTT